MDQGLLGNRYEVVRPIGTGDMTRVLEAWDRLAGRRIALKVPIGRLASDAAFLERLQREVAALAGFSHPNVAAVHAVQRDDHTGFVVTELVDGSSLHQMLAARGPLPPAGAARIAVQVCAALLAAHQRGLTHGNLTTANILLAIDGRVKLTDFRLAQAARPMAASDPAADLRALGRCLGAMLTGREPGVEQPPRLGPEVPAELAAIVARAVGVSGRGYRSAGDLGGDLDRFLATVGPSAAPTAQPDAAPAQHPPAVAAAASSTAAQPEPSSAPGLPDHPAALEAAPRARRRRGLPAAAGLAGAGLVLVGAVVAIRLLGGEPTGPAASQALAPPSSAIPATTTSQPTAGRAPSTTASTTTAPPTTTRPSTVISRPTTTPGQAVATGQQIVPNVVGLHREQAADVLAQARLSAQILLFPVGDPAQVQRVIAQQPSAGQVVPAGSEVRMLVGTKRPSG
jgi:tRNA A-37 threonylcarbamoyl transferase component Bud32